MRLQVPGAGGGSRAEDRAVTATTGARRRPLHKGHRVGDIPHQDLRWTVDDCGGWGKGGVVNVGELDGEGQQVWGHQAVTQPSERCALEMAWARGSTLPT